MLFYYYVNNFVSIFLEHFYNFKKMDKFEFINAFGKLVEVNDKKYGDFFTFVPSKLPPQLDFDKKVINALSRADSTLSKLSGAGLFLSNPNLLVTPYMKKEAISSSRIEGTQISLSEFFLQELENESNNSHDALEVNNYMRALNYGLKKIKTQNITVKLIREMHKILLIDVRGNDKSPGSFRDVQNWIGIPGSLPQEAKFVPPPVGEVERLLNELIDYINTYDEIPLLIKCALIHYQFETIHPFCDGNGRIGRVLITLYLIKKNKISKPLLYLSAFFERYKSMYCQLLLNANSDSKFIDWIFFFLNAIRVQAEDALDKTIQIQTLREQYRGKIQAESQNIQLLLIIDNLFINPYVGIKNVQKIVDVTFPTAKKLVDKLVDMGILKLRIKGKKRSKIYVAYEILEIIELKYYN